MGSRLQQSLINAVKQEIADRCEPCPFCGNPIAEQVVTVQLTSKRWKLTKLAASLMIIGGGLMFIKNIQDGGFQNPYTGLGFCLGFLGLIGLYVGRFGAWWTNK